jgi:RNA polymerase sigma-70 factor (ECF subfamily)
MGSGEEPPNRNPQAGNFATTQWSLVLKAGGVGQGKSAEALASLLETYWYPLYAYLRRRGLACDEAEDVVQGFFARLLEKNTLAAATSGRGRFRSFLLTAINNYLANERDHARAQKRGGNQRLLSLDFVAGESRLSLEPAHTATPERLFERQWAITLLATVMQRLEAEYHQAGKDRQFALLKETLAASGERVGFAKLGEDLGLTENATRQAASRLKKRYRELIREEVAQTVSEPHEVDDEIRGLFEALHHPA